MLLLMGGQLLELLVYYHRAELLAPLAVLPIGPRRTVPLPAAAEEAMTTLESGAATYRTSAPRSLDLSRIHLSGSVDVTDATLLFSMRPARVLARRHWGINRKARALVRVDVTAGEHRIELDPRFYPIGALSILAAVIGAGFDMHTPAVVILALVTVPALAVYSWFAASRHADAIAEEVTRRVRALARPAPAIRVETRARVAGPSFHMEPPRVRADVDANVDHAETTEAPTSERSGARH